MVHVGATCHTNQKDMRQSTMMVHVDNGSWHLAFPLKTILVPIMTSPVHKSRMKLGDKLLGTQRMRDLLLF